MQGNDSFRLVVRRGPQPNQVYELNKDIVTIGRDITNDIVINDPEVSRHHLRFTRGAGGFTIEDLGSTNGTFVGGQRLTGAKPLNPNDMIGLGETVTLSYEVVRAPGMDAPAATVQSYPPASPQPSPYAPPVQQQPPAQQPSYGYPPQQASTPPGAYSPPAPAPQQPSYSAPSSAPVAPQQPSYATPGQPAAGGQSPYGTPPAAPPSVGYEYDPYLDEEPRSNVRLILIGCIGLALFCCCATVVGLVIIDTFDLWDDIPIFSNTITPLLRGLFGYNTILLPPIF